MPPALPESSIGLGARFTHVPNIPGELAIAPDHAVLSHWTANVILDEVRRNPRLLLGAAAGCTPSRTYGLLAEMARSEPRTFQQLRIVKLDEWGGLPMDDPATCEVYLGEKLLRPLAIAEDRYLGWNSDPGDPAAECARIASWLSQQGPMDLCLLGLSVNGHLALIEPADVLQTGPHVAQLSESSLSHSMLSTALHRPRFGLTIGLADILQSRRIVLIVSGRQKSRPLRRLLEPGVSTQFPASFLQLHRRVTIFCDREAAPDHDFFPHGSNPGDSLC
jgi:galactosamine-6-phosphate isomerase